jgi:acetyl-CoA C-acetyltransferase
MLAAQAIQVGDADVVVAGGMENMSMAPHFLDRSRTGYRMGHGVLKDSMIHDGLWDHVNDFHMGISNDLCAEKYGVSREDQDRYAAESYRRSREAIAEGRFNYEILPVEVPRRKGAPVVFERDECARETAYEVLAAMRPAFQPTGTATAGNASIISDGAAAVVVMAREKAEALGCPIMAVIGAQASYGIDMKYVLVAPIWAVPKCLAKQGLGTGDVDLFEINEAFSGSILAVLQELRLDPAKVNVNGGAVSLGHPIGASGCRVLVTLLYEMIRRGSRTGLASLCLGGGEAVAMVVKRP